MGTLNSAGNFIESGINSLVEHYKHQSDIHKNSSGIHGAISGKPKDKSSSYQPGQYY